MARIAWLSAGVSSFVASYISNPDRVVYIDVANQHPDSLRFIYDCQKFLKVKIEFLRDIKYSGCVDNVINSEGFITAASGAPCTTLLKKRVRQEFERTLTEPPIYIWGFDTDEKLRAFNLARNSEWKNEFPLISNNLNKKDVHAICERLGLKRPIMYDMGYNNNNCIGCVRGGMGYWNKIRKDFPEVFERRAKQERLYNSTCIKGMFLDELEPNRGNINEIIPECSIACGMIEINGGDNNEK